VSTTDFTLRVSGLSSNYSGHGAPQDVDLSSPAASDIASIWPLRLPAE